VTLTLIRLISELMMVGAFLLLLVDSLFALIETWHTIPPSKRAFTIMAMFLASWLVVSILERLA
jgi:hypothetical protein